MRAQRRRTFVDAAWRCAARRGFRDLTVDDVCDEAGLSKGAFYGYFDNKQHLLLALLEDESGALDGLMSRIAADTGSAVARLRRFAEAALAHGEETGHAQVRADLWAALLTEPQVSERFAETVKRRRALLRSWIEEGVRSGELEPIPANALASILLALSDGLLLHGALDERAFRWRNIRRAVDGLLEGIALR